MPSLAALKILTWLESDYLAVPDSAALNGMKALAGGVNSDSLVVYGESLTASVSVMLGLSADELLRDRLGRDSSSQAVLFGLEYIRFMENKTKYNMGSESTRRYAL
jgi:diaminopropionate ammonia-lyase